ncbi:MAG: hypothetical protein ACFFD4_08020 [Candidatus Odinarchaeota archaeon]
MDKENIKECADCGEDFCQSCSSLGGTCDRCDEPLCDDCNRSNNGLCSDCKEAKKEQEEQEREAESEAAKINILHTKNEVCQSCDFKYKEIDSFPCSVCSTGPRNGITDHYRQEIS